MAGRERERAERERFGFGSVPAEGSVKVYSLADKLHLVRKRKRAFGGSTAFEEAVKKRLAQDGEREGD